MANKIVKGLVGAFGGLLGTALGKYIFVFIISLMPILELRGGLIAASLLKMDMIPSIIVCTVANILVIPIVLFLIEKIFDLLSKNKTLKKGIDKWKKSALSKKDQIEKYGYVGLTLFVGIPLPGTGAWTGCLLAVLLGLDKKKSFIAAMLGVIMAGVIMTIVSFGILGNVIK